MEAQIIQAIYFLVDSGISPTESAIISSLSAHRADKIIKILRAMQNDGQLTARRVDGDIEFWVTSIGHIYYDAACEDPFDNYPNYNDWIDEVQTGINKDGFQTAVQNPVVPNSQYMHEQDPEQSMHRAIARFKRARTSRKMKKYQPRRAGGDTAGR